MSEFVGGPASVPVLLLSTADTELLAARASGALYRTANPARIQAAGLAALLEGVAIIVLRLLGGRRAWPQGVDALVASGVPVVLSAGRIAQARPESSSPKRQVERPGSCPAQA